MWPTDSITSAVSCQAERGARSFQQTHATTHIAPGALRFRRRVARNLESATKPHTSQQTPWIRWKMEGESPSRDDSPPTDSAIKLYISSVSSNREIKWQQQHIARVLEGKKIPFEKVDIAIKEEWKIQMREGCKNSTALPPQIFKGNVYLGASDDFDEAVETGNLESFLHLV